MLHLPEEHAAVNTGTLRCSVLFFSIVASLLDRLIGDTFTINLAMGPMSLGYGYIYLLYSLAVLIPSLAVGVRRLHDVGKSGWFFFYCFDTTDRRYLDFNSFLHR